MSTSTLRFVKFTENNEWEGEIFTTWLQVDGNEAQLDKLCELLDEAAVDEEGETDENFPYELTLRSEETLTEEHVDVLVEHAEHTKVVGKFTCPDTLGEDCRLIYKGQISELFTAEVSGA